MFKMYSAFLVAKNKVNIFMNLISKSHERYSHFCTHLRRNWTNVLFTVKLKKMLLKNI
jgi:hypothetical protein